MADEGTRTCRGHVEDMVEDMSSAWDTPVNEPTRKGEMGRIDFVCNTLYV